jgi:hypothetical protein
MRDVHALGQPAGGHQERAVLDHQRDRLIIDEKTVLDAVDPGLHRVLDRVGAVGVCGDPQPAPVCLIDDSAQLLVRIMLRASRTR